MPVSPGAQAETGVADFEKRVWGVLTAQVKSA